MAYVFANEAFNTSTLSFGLIGEVDRLNDIDYSSSYNEFVAEAYSGSVPEGLAEGPEINVHDRIFFEKLGMGSAGDITMSEGAVTGGQVQCLDFLDEGVEWVDWNIIGLSLNAVDVWDAVSSKSSGDDRNLVRSALAGSDTFHLSYYNDYANGFSGDDSVYGYDGNDSLFGGGGSDRIIGGKGTDQLSGGTGEDRFAFSKITESGITATTSDVITDFVRGQDKIKLSAIDAFGSSGTNDTFVFRGTAAFSSTTEGEVRYEKFDNSGTTNDYTMIWIDNDADTAVEMAIRLTGLYTLTASDFIL